MQELIKWAYSSSFSKEKVATVAKTVCRTAEMGDRVSIDILKEEAEEAVLSAATVVNKLNLADKEFDFVLVGSVFNCRKYFKDILVKELKNKFPKINFKPLTKKPVEGAIRLALQNI